MVTLALLRMEGEPLLGTQRDTPSLTPAMQDTSSLESLEELVSLMEYGQGICLLVRVSALLWIRLYMHARMIITIRTELFHVSEFLPRKRNFYTMLLPIRSCHE